jgi:hypothetical protein
MKYPKVYLLSEKDDAYEVYFGDFSTLDGIKLLDKSLYIKIEEFGATNYKKLGFATENDIPQIENIEQCIHFLENENLDIIECRIKIAGLGRLSTHDDSKCFFIVDSKKMALDLIKKATPILHQEKMAAELIHHQNTYITIDSNGNIERYMSLEDYMRFSIM